LNFAAPSYFARTLPLQVPFHLPFAHPFQLHTTSISNSNQPVPYILNLTSCTSPDKPAAPPFNNQPMPCPLPSLNPQFSFTNSTPNHLHHHRFTEPQATLYLHLKHYNSPWLSYLQLHKLTTTCNSAHSFQLTTIHHHHINFKTITTATTLPQPATHKFLNHDADIITHRLSSLHSTPQNPASP
jgi:hypothetical protein